MNIIHFLILIYLKNDASREKKTEFHRLDFKYLFRRHSTDFFTRGGPDQLGASQPPSLRRNIFTIIVGSTHIESIAYSYEHIALSKKVLKFLTIYFVTKHTLKNIVI